MVCCGNQSISQIWSFEVFFSNEQCNTHVNWIQCKWDSEWLRRYMNARTSKMQWNDNDDDVRFVLDDHAKLYFYNA